MPPSAKRPEILDKVTERVERIGSLANDFGEAYQKIKEAMIFQIKNVLKDKWTMQQVMVTNKNIERWLNGLGYDKLYIDYVNTISNIKVDSVQFYKDLEQTTKIKLNPAFTQTDFNALNAISGLMNQTFSFMGKEVALKIQTYLVEQTLAGGKTFDQFIKGLEKEYTVGMARTYAETAALDYDRQANELLSESMGLEYYLYDGAPLLNTSRDYCVDRYGKYFTKAQKERDEKKWNKWNCRHMYWALPLSFLKENGYQSGS